MGSIRQSFNQPKNIKNIIETPNQPIEIKKISNKSMFITLKVKGRQKFIWKITEGVCRFNTKS
jgi:hypothetical protein